jgi:cephalosporin-C deacetylase-like acetyl esterase
LYFTKLIKEEITPYEIIEENPKRFAQYWKGIEKSLQLHNSRKSDK